MSDERDSEGEAVDPEPPENISGGSDGGGAAAVFEPGEAATRAEAVVDRLGELYWQKTYGGQDAFECLVRTVLSQNTSDKASQPAHDALLERYGGDSDRSAGADETDGDLVGADSGGPPDGGLAANLARAEHGELADTIRHAGLYNQKAETLIDLAARVVAEYGGCGGFDSFVKEEDPATVRSTLLELDGVGPKTADCVLLFSGGRAGVFPVDTHVHRIYRRLGVAPPDADHEAVREVLERAVPAEKCGFGHTASIQFGREYCSATRPACLDVPEPGDGSRASGDAARAGEGPEACPLYELCERVGVDEATGEVLDPGATVE